MAFIIVDPGSTHMGKMEYAKELIDVAVDAGADAVKFQLFKNLPPNIELPYEWFPELVQYGRDKKIEVFASVFNKDAVDLIDNCQCKYIKFSYGETRRFANTGLALIDIPPNANPIWSADFMIPSPPISIGKKNILLYCIPEYPVKYEISFDGVFPRFDGFSDHTIGFRQTLRACAYGAKYIEKHITLDRSGIQCADHNFALRPKELRAMIKEIKK